MKTATLEAVEDATWLAIRAGEEWAASFHKAPDQLEALIKVESRMQRNLRRYFRGLPQRALQLISWPEYQRQVIKAYDVVVDIDNQFATQEDQLLLQVVYNDVVVMTSLGAIAGEHVYGVTAGLSPASVEVQKAATKLTDKLVAQITSTTKKQIEQSVQTSLKLGEDITTASARLQKTVGGLDISARRAILISRTESTRAFSNGIDVYGLQTGAVSKIWRTAADPCRICEPLDGQEVPIDGQFDTAVGPLDGSPAHPACKCGKELNYNS